jgi:molybdenum cofactor synthesis domain-containing protein
MTNENKLSLKVAVITVSDRSARGERDDLSGPAAKETLSEILLDHDVTFELKLVADDANDLKGTLSEFVRSGYDFIFTTGGTGIGPRDITPEAVREVVDRELPGIGEVMRSFSMGITKNAMLSRGLAGVAGSSLIVALPGSPKAVREILNYLGNTLEHACYMVRGLDVH